MMDLVEFQQRAYNWALECFGEEIVFNKSERNHRFLEESLELVQSLDMTYSECQELVNYVYSREKGDPPQEVGGVEVTLATLCSVNTLDLNESADNELKRISNPDMMNKIRQKQANKPKGTLPKPKSVTQQVIELLNKHPIGNMVFHHRDGFTGSVQGAYVTREGRAGLVIQQSFNKVVHVYHTQWLTNVSDLNLGENLLPAYEKDLNTTDQFYIIGFDCVDNHITTLFHKDGQYFFICNIDKHYLFQDYENGAIKGVYRIV